MDNGNGSAVPPSMPRLVTAPSPATLPNSSLDDLVRGSEKRSFWPGTARSGLVENSDESEAIRSHELSGGISRHSVDTLNSEEKKRLLDAKLLRKKADEDALMMKNRIQKLKIEEARARKNIAETQKRADEIVHLKAENELKARAKENARMLKEQQLRRDMQQKSLIRAQRDAAIRANRQATIRMKQSLVENSRKEKHMNAQATWEFKRLEEERVAKRVQDIYVRDRQVVHQRYRQKHLALIQVAQSYEQRVAEEEKRRAAREEEIIRLEKEESDLLERLKNAQELQKSAYAELEVALDV